MYILVIHISLTFEYPRCFSGVMKPSSVAVFGWVSLVVVGIPSVGWASSFAVVGGTSSDI